MNLSWWLKTLQTKQHAVTRLSASGHSPTPVLFGLALVFSLTSCAPANAPWANSDVSSEQKPTPRVVYGNDDRHDLYAENNPALRQAARAVAAVIHRTQLTQVTEDTVNLATKTFAIEKKLCADEPFRDQQTGSFCTAFLVAPDKLVTAGHCISSGRDCDEAAFVFDFVLDAPVTTPLPSGRLFKTENVYMCARVIHSQAPARGADFAIIELDRPVSDRSPLFLRKEGTIAPGEEISVMGHPAGLPLKIAGGAKVRSVTTAGYFTANLDTYGGNSGSPVFNLKTLQVEGILVRGELDFSWRNESPPCMASVRCADETCRGEDATTISEILRYLGP